MNRMKIPRCFAPLPLPTPHPFTRPFPVWKAPRLLFSDSNIPYLQFTHTNRHCLPWEPELGNKLFFPILNSPSAPPPCRQKSDTLNTPLLFPRAAYLSAEPLLSHCSDLFLSVVRQRGVVGAFCCSLPIRIHDVQTLTMPDDDQPLLDRLGGAFGARGHLLLTQRGGHYGSETDPLCRYERAPVLYF